MQFSYIINAELPNRILPRDSFVTYLQELKEAGYDGIECNLPYPFPACVVEWEKLAEILDKIRLKLVSFLTGSSYFRDGLCLCSSRASIRQQTIERLRASVEVAAKFDAITVIGQMQGFPKDAISDPAGKLLITRGLSEICRRAQEVNTTVVLEPVNHLQVGFNHTVDEVIRVIDQVGSPALRPMVDTFHVNIEEKSVVDAIRIAGQHGLSHVHLCETNAGTFGTGHLDFPVVLRTLREIKYDGFVSVKICREPNLEKAILARHLISQIQRGL